MPLPQTQRLREFQRGVRRGPKQRCELLRHGVAIHCDDAARGPGLGAHSSTSRREHDALVHGASDHLAARSRLEAAPQRQFDRIAQFAVRADER